MFPHRLSTLAFAFLLRLCMLGRSVRWQFSVSLILLCFSQRFFFKSQVVGTTKYHIGKCKDYAWAHQGWAVGIFSRAQRFLEQDDHSHKIALMRPWTRWRPFWAISIYEQIWQETTTSSSSWNRNSRYSILPIFLGLVLHLCMALL